LHFERVVVITINTTMKKTLLLASLFCSLICGLQAQTASKMDTISYNLGVLIAQNLKRQGFNGIDAAQCGQGIADVLSGKAKDVDLNKANQMVTDYLQAERSKVGEKEIQVGKDFLAKNKTRAEVKSTASGLQYEILKPGAGAKPGPNDKVTVHYHGMLLDGTVFDSSVERGQPATFGVTQVIQGWIEGLQLMPLGAKYKFYIPYDLAYGDRGAGGDIGPYATLIFEVELLKIN
jgi:FKBP-type peptidyl-prolyl cis-trans isomerase FklB